jgi:CRP/FNR family cyclic AMP-dependent transcriptional regulator
MMDTNPLSNLPQFSGMSVDEMALVSAVMSEERWAAGETILEQGDTGGGVYFVLDGKIRIDRELRTGEIVTVGRIGSGAVFGVLGVLDGVPRAATCVALSEVCCGVMKRAEFMDMMDGTSTLAMRFQISILRYLARDVRRTNERLAQLAAVSACSVSSEDLEEIFPELTSAS